MFTVIIPGGPVLGIGVISRQLAGCCDFERPCCSEQGAASGNGFSDLWDGTRLLTFKMSWLPCLQRAWQAYQTRQ